MLEKTNNNINEISDSKFIRNYKLIIIPALVIFIVGLVFVSYLFFSNSFTSTQEQNDNVNNTSDIVENTIPNNLKVSDTVESNIEILNSVPDETLYVTNSDKEVELILIPLNDEQSFNLYNFFSKSIYKFNNRVSAHTQNEPDFKIAISFLSNDSLYITEYPLTLYVSNTGSSAKNIVLSEFSDFSNSVKLQLKDTIEFNYTPGDGEKSIYAKLIYTDGHESSVKKLSYVVDTNGPIGGIGLSNYFVGRDIIRTTVYLGAQDDVSGVSDMRISTKSDFSDAVWRPYAASLEYTFNKIESSQDGFIYAQFRDNAGNESQVYDVSYIYDNKAPLVYVEVPGESNEMKRTVNIYAYDEISNISKMYITNDPMLSFENMVEYSSPIPSTLEWEFDDRRVVWVQVKDYAGNLSEAFPAYAARVDEANQYVEPTILPTTVTVPTNIIQINKLENAVNRYLVKEKITKLKINNETATAEYKVNSTGENVKVAVIEYKGKRYLVVNYGLTDRQID